MKKGTSWQLDLALFLLRLVAGLILFYAGAQKFFGWFGGMGFQPTLDMFQNGMHIPPWLAVLAMVAEFFGGIALMLGAIARVASFGAVCTMLVATYENIHGLKTINSTKENPMPLVGVMMSSSVLVMTAAVLILGAGTWSLDNWLFSKRRKGGF